MVRFMVLREMKGGSKRAAKFFEENLLKPMHRSIVLALLHDQRDPIKRLRGNNGARDILRPKGIYLLSGAFFNPTLMALKYEPIDADEWIAVEAGSPTEVAALEAAFKKVSTKSDV